jgi:hypothetical protein
LNPRHVTITLKVVTNINLPGKRIAPGDTSKGEMYGKIDQQKTPQMQFPTDHHRQSKVHNCEGFFYAKNQTRLCENARDGRFSFHDRQPGKDTLGNKAVMTLATLSAQHIPSNQPAIFDTALPVSEYINITPIMMVETTANITATWPLRLLATAHIGPSQGMAARLKTGQHSKTEANTETKNKR